MLHELVQCSKEIIAVLSGNIVIAVGARCTDVHTRKRISGQGMLYRDVE